MRSTTLALLAVAARLAAQPPLVEQGYDHFYNLEYDQAIRDFRSAIQQDPLSPDLHNHVASAIVFREMLRNGALESELVSGNNSFLRRPRLNPSAQTEKEFVAEVSQAIEIAEARLKVSPNDARAMYALGISYGLRSNYNWVVRKAWHDSLRDATAARRFHNRVSELEPSNVDARLVQGLHDYIVGSLPLMYRMLGFLVGIRGDKEQGIRTVQQVASAGKLNCVDAEIFLGALYRRENQPRLAIPIVERLMRRYPRNYLLWLELSQMYSMAGDGKRALEILDQLAQLKTRHAPGYDGLSWEKIHFQRGTTQFWYRDLDHALENLNKVAAAAEEVDLNTGAYAFLRIGQIYDLKNRRGLALEAYKKALAYAPQAEAAQESQKYISHPYRRPTLQ